VGGKLDVLNTTLTSEHRSGIHGAQSPAQSRYFPNDPNRKWVTVQGPAAGGMTQAHHFPVDGSNKFDPNVGVVSLGPNQNRGRTRVPGSGPAVQRRWLRARDAYLDTLEELEARDLYSRDAEALAYDGLDDMDLYAREADSEPEAYDDYDFDLYAREMGYDWE
jgi:hypothetical protein